ncbi:MAG: hypothetical protein ACXVSJ_17880 [Solirubrobacteraceae bacterium]
MAVVHAYGYVPASATDDGQPTWRAALDRVTAGTEVAPVDLRRAREILGWAASLKPRDPDSYRSRLAACLAQDRLTVADLPLAASAVRAFNLHLYYELRGRKRRGQAQSAASSRSGT